VAKSAADAALQKTGEELAQAKAKLTSQSNMFNAAMKARLRAAPHHWARCTSARLPLWPPSAIAVAAA
jgi:hypothetical protein